ncbi:MAG: MerR family transcriptional regulator [Rectinema sp.]
MPYVSIGQLEKLLSVPASTLRFWEKSVPFLTPLRTKSGRRTYSLSEVALIARLKHLALDRKFGLRRAQRLLEFEMLYEDQDYRANIKALRDGILLLMMESGQWQQAYRDFTVNAKKSGKELFDGAEDQAFDGFH